LKLTPSFFFVVIVVVGVIKVLGAVIRAGATTLNIPDTVGYTTPEEYGKMMKHLVAHTPGAEKVLLLCHRLLILFIFQVKFADIHQIK
jgi:isopropylmalate/homocitrate/citramalate synthase